MKENESRSKVNDALLIDFASCTITYVKIDAEARVHCKRSISTFHMIVYRIATN